jgi:hypothetical protein
MLGKGGGGGGGLIGIVIANARKGDLTVMQIRDENICPPPPPQYHTRSYCTAN